MEYTILRLNDNDTATVELKASNGHILNQDFPLGDSPADLEDNIKQGLAVLETELNRKQQRKPDIDISAYEPLVDQKIALSKDSLPVIAEADLLQEAVEVPKQVNPKKV